MAIIVDVSPEEEARFRVRAEEMGQDLPDYTLALLRRDSAGGQTDAPIEGDDAPPQRTLAEALEGLTGVVNSGGKFPGRDSGRIFTEMIVEKHKAGRL
jgi:hypothetical protein